MMVMKIDLTTRQWILVVVGLLLVPYVLFQARFLILGPQVEIISPKDAEIVTNEVLNIKGVAKNVSWIALNGRQIFTDEEGVWEETLLLSPGVSIMTVAVRDRFGREREESVRVIYNQ